MKRLVITCVFIIIVRSQDGNDASALQRYSRASENKPPENIYPIGSKQVVMLSNETEKLIQEGTQLEIKCKSLHPVKFSFLNSMFWSCDTKTETSSNNGIYTFLIRQARSKDTGWYACATQGTEIPNDWKLLNSTNGNIKWIYIFVNSSKPFVDWLPAMPKTIIVTGTHAVVPCRTTSPKLDVKLLVNFENVERNETISFDPKIGYTLKRPAFEEFESLFTCQFAGVEDNYILRYSNGGGRKPKIISPASGALELAWGASLEIKCDGGSAVQFAFPVRKGRLESTTKYNISSGPSGTRIFSRPHIQIEDSGWYGCAQKDIDTTIPYFSIDYTRNEISWVYVHVSGYKSIFLPWYFYSYVGKNFTIIPDREVINDLRGDSCKVPTNVNNGSELFHFPRYGNFYRGNNRPDFTTESILIFPPNKYFISSADEINSQELFFLEIPKSIFRVGENLHGRCEKASYNASEFCILKWTLPKTVTSKRVMYTFSRRYEPLSYYNVYYKIINFTITNITKYDGGIYYCECNSRRGGNQRIQKQIEVIDDKSPEYISADSEAENKFENQEGMTIRWVIDFSKYPGSHAKWWVSSPNSDPTQTLDPRRQSIKTGNRFEIIVETALTILIISNITHDDSGMYLVEILNSTTQKLLTNVTVTLEVQGMDPNLFLSVTISLVVCILIISAVVLWLCMLRFRRKKAERKWKDVTLARFNAEPIYFLDPTSANDDRIVMPKYDEKWEFPPKLLKLGKELGKGAFGVVRKAQAKSICPGEPVTTVAVKMVRSTYSLNYMTALSHELKILVYLGKHVNIVNLLGACTKKISYGELLVIVEFCHFGNMRDYLLHRKNDFINQLESTPEGVVGSTHSLNGNDVKHSKGPSGAPDNLLIDDKDLIEPKLPSAYQVDRANLPLESMTTQDLICWVWQVSRGMAYLGSKKVVHGDLAARNILLADNNVVKICDFGLAAMLFKDDDQTKQEQCLLPVKWMAVESIKDGTFSIKSDVWSFGIVLWEFFSLGETPYPGISTSVVHEKLVNGYRMEPPNYAPKKICNLMKKCWQAEPSERPSFADITRTINDLMGENVERYYLDMDGLYAEVNEVSSLNDVVSFHGVRERVYKASIELQINRNSSAQAPIEMRL